MALFLLYSNPFSFAGMPAGVVIAIVFINTFMFPAISILLMRKLGFIDSLSMPDNKQRIIPLVATIVFYVWAYLAMRKTNFPYMMMIFMMGALVSLFISFVHKCFFLPQTEPAHGGHQRSTDGGYDDVVFFSDGCQLLLSNHGCTNRSHSERTSYLGAHTLQEVYAGFIIGIFGQMLGLFLSVVWTNHCRLTISSHFHILLHPNVSIYSRTFVWNCRFKEDTLQLIFCSCLSYAQDSTRFLKVRNIYIGNKNRNLLSSFVK